MMYLDSCEEVYPAPDYTGVWVYSDESTDYFFKGIRHRLDGPASYDNTCHACDDPVKCYCYYDYYILNQWLDSKSTILLVLTRKNT